MNLYAVKEIAREMTEVNMAMPDDSEQAEQTQSRRRSTDTEFVRSVQAADTGLSISRRFVEVVVLLIFLGINIGIQYQQNAATRADFLDFKNEIRQRLDHIADDAKDAKGDARDLKGQNAALQKQLDGLSGTVDLQARQLANLEKSYARIEGMQSVRH